MNKTFVSPDELRTRFAGSLQNLYRAEVPAYVRLHDLVLELNGAVLRERGDARAGEPDFVEALSAPRHGAIRVGSAEELAWLARLFALFGMQPVDFYDLTPAGLPVMSTAFRPVSPESLAHNPFRMFCSLLRPDLIEDEAVRHRAVEAISVRRIFSPALQALIEAAEGRGGVLGEEADGIISEAIEVFRWHGTACVDQPAYDALAAAHKLVADIAAFAGPHINHLTPRVLDIDRLQAAMVERGFNAKAIVEGPPRREVPIFLRQTACNAAPEAVTFPAEGGATDGSHTARFGEVEERGVALTERGRALYDACLDNARSIGRKQPYAEALTDAFSDFPDDVVTLIEQDLAYFEYSPVGGVPTADLSTPQARADAVRGGAVTASPIRYEDFLPISAAGIFRSNLGASGAEGQLAQSSQALFEEALGRPVVSSQRLYAEQQEASIEILSRAHAA